MIMMLTGLVLVTIGAVLRYAIDSDWDGVDVPVVGLILGCVGLVAFVVGLLQTFLLREQKQPAHPAPAQHLPPAQAYPHAAPPVYPPAATAGSPPPPSNPPRS